MILTFRCKDTEALYTGDSPRRFRAFQAQAERKLQMLDSANARYRGFAQSTRQPVGKAVRRSRGPVEYSD